MNIFTALGATAGSNVPIYNDFFDNSLSSILLILLPVGITALIISLKTETTSAPSANLVVSTLSVVLITGFLLTGAVRNDYVYNTEVNTWLEANGTALCDSSAVEMPDSEGNRVKLLVETGLGLAPYDDPRLIYVDEGRGPRVYIDCYNGGFTEVTVIEA